MNTITRSHNHNRKQIRICLLFITAMTLGYGFLPPHATAYTSASCISNTVDEAECKNCCDCLDVPGERQSCRDTCATHDFSDNSDFIFVDASSVLGPDGDYSLAVAAGSEQACKQYCDESEDIACGDRRYCRDVCNITDFQNTGSTTSPNPDGEGMNIEQTLSDQAQRTTVAFDSLAYLTGDLCADTFLPPGKVADFSGFQYLRDNDPTGLGHNTDFVTIIAFNILDLLSEGQIAQLVTLAQSQVSMINEHGYKRFPLMKAFRRLLEDEIPATSEGLSKSGVMAYSAELYRLDGQISYDRAEILGKILRNLTASQQTALDSLKALNGIGNWDSNKQDPLSLLYPRLSHDEHVAVMTYASEIYSWYAGSVEADTYFCPERQGTYFGSFYMKDMPAMGNPNFTIPDHLTAEMGDRFLETLTSPQAEMVTDLVDIQRAALYEIVATRRAISTQLRLFITQETVDEAGLLALAERYGELDGEIVFNYATNFAALADTLSTTQETELMALREEWNDITCTGAYLYSEPINMPVIMDTDFLFNINSGRTLAGMLQLLLSN